MGLKKGRGCDWNCQSWHRQSALGTSPQLGVNNDSVQVRLYCFWPKAFCKNNFVTYCQGSFCPQRRQKNKEQKWECLYLIPISPKHRGRTDSRCGLPGRCELGEGGPASPMPGCHSAPSSCHTDLYTVLQADQAHFHHRAFALPVKWLRFGDAASPRPSSSRLGAVCTSPAQPACYCPSKPRALAWHPTSVSLPPQTSQQPPSETGDVNFSF